ncbi:MAG: methionyl-tRNA formyltransferase [Treponema sp.]|jgi:methionyl-tRNA formyltransferase|nr:methionyl-tRNA formyltransferase [Treponema sp.]
MSASERRPLRVLFAGSPAIAVPSLEAIAALEAEGGAALAGVLSNPDKSRGRSAALEPTEVAAAAAALSGGRASRGKGPVPLLKPPRLDAEARAAVQALESDLLVCFSYGKIFGPAFMGLFPLGGINVHPSLLPRHRGPSPIPTAILEGDGETGVCIQRIAPQMDTGALAAVERIALTGRETTASLSALASEKGAALLKTVLRELAAAGTNEARAALLDTMCRPQEGAPTYSRLLVKEDGRIAWGKSAAAIDAQIRAYTPWPLSFTACKGDLLFALEAAPYAGPPVEGGAEPGTVLGVDKTQGILVRTGDGVLAITRLQWRAKKALHWKSFLNGARNFIGTVFA